MSGAMHGAGVHAVSKLGGTMSHWVLEFLTIIPEGALSDAQATRLEHRLQC